MKEKRSDFTAEEIRQILHYDPETGSFTWRPRPSHPKKWNTRYAGKPAGTRAKTGYLYIELRRKLPTKAARIAWVYMTGRWPAAIVDHRNGKREDDSWKNLRLSDHSENAVNKAKQRNNTSGFVGVSFERHTQKWRARINFRRTCYDVGLFATAEEAAVAREHFEKSLRIHGEFAPDGTERPRYFHQRDVAKDG